MNYEIKPLQLIIENRHYNGDYGVGSVLESRHVFTLHQLSDSNNNNYGIITYYKEIGFCGNIKLRRDFLANIKTEIPFVVKLDKIQLFYELISEIKSNKNYKYDETHYSKTGFDFKKYNYMDVFIGDEKFETNDRSIFTKLNNIIDFENYSRLMDDYERVLSDTLEKTDNYNSCN